MHEIYYETKPLYIEIDVSGVVLRAILLQTRSNTSCPKDEAPDNSTLRPIAFASKSLTGAEKRYSNIEKEALAILKSWKFHHYCLTRQASIITDHKQLIAILKKDKATLLQRLQ